MPILTLTKVEMLDISEDIAHHEANMKTCLRQLHFLRAVLNDSHN